MQPSEKSVSKNALTAILLYELSQLENLSATDQMRAASELSAAIQTIKIASKSDQSFFKNQVSFYKSVKDELSTSGSSNTRTTKFIVAGVMECICKSAEIDGLQDTLITSVKHWIRGSGRKIYANVVNLNYQSNHAFDVSKCINRTTFELNECYAKIIKRI